METKIIKGYAVTFDKKENIANKFYEVIDPHAFDNTDLSDVRLEYNLLDITRICNLKLNVDDKGVYFKSEVPQFVDKKNIGIEFTVKKEEWSNCSADMPTRTITEIERLHSISIKN